MWGNDDDEDFLRALEESRRLYEEVEIPRLSQQVNAASPITISDEDSLPGPSTHAQSKSTRNLFKEPLPPDASEDGSAEELYDGPESSAQGFDINAGQVWAYPTSDMFPIRTYQRSIVETALFNNTLVSLPTGLGKTFIAAAVMYNYYKWYPKGKIIFMAPTKPLVAQQIDNCIDIMGIPRSHTAQMTGATQSKLRAGTWKEKRVFFLTPQVVQNDLSANICPANAVKCVVIDEAHRAQGDHAYAQVIRLLNSYDAHYRILALSATPGSDLEAVQKVVSNLMISHIELRTEDSPDIMQYTHQRDLELMVVDVGPTINRIRIKFVAIAAEYAQQLQQRKLLFGSVSSIPKFTILKEWENFRREKSNHMDPTVVNKINCDFSLVHTLVYGLELLQTYGLRLLLKHLKGALEKGDATANRLSVNEELKALMEEIESVLNPVDIDGDENNEKKRLCIYGHPKLDRLQGVIVSHFESFQQKGEATRAIVFCEYREGVIEICDMLKNFQPLVKPVAFMGQSAGKTSKGISQKQQLEIMEKFRKGMFNTLISTSVGEEGLDIGEVDLIICFDAKNSPIRQVQRMGRTGRKRKGRIIMLVTRGKEEQKYNQGLHKKKNVRAVLLNRENLAGHLLEESPRMLPPGIQPKYTERKVVPAASKPKTNQQDIRKMWHTTGRNSGTSKSSTGGRTALAKVPYLSEDDLEDLNQTWNSQDCYKFDRIPDKTELWTTAPDLIGAIDESPNKIDLATYLEYMRFRQRTHIVSNSSDSNMLSDLLMWADDRRDSDDSTPFGGLSSQVTSTQIWPNNPRKRGRPAANNLINPKQPKKRGRPKKDASANSPLPVQPIEDTDSTDDQSAHQSARRRSKPLFIEDEEEDHPFAKPEPLHEPQKLKTPSPKIALPCSKIDSSCVKNDSPISSVITLDSDSEDDLDSSFGHSQFFSQPYRQDLYSELSRALKKLPVDEEDECVICDSLFLCESFNKLVVETKRKRRAKSWKEVHKSLDEALILAPLLSKEVLTKHHTSNVSSQRFVSLMPKPEIAAEDEMLSGLLCGGVGDFSPPEVFHEDQKMDFEEHFTNRKADKDNIAHFSTPRRKSEFKHDSNAEDKCDSLGLSRIKDVNSSLMKDKKDVAQSKTNGESFLKQFSPTVKNTDLLNSKNTLRSKSPTLEVSCKHEDVISVKSLTPKKENSVIPEQVSPILCSQAIKKPRSTLRLKKDSTQNLSILSGTRSISPCKPLGDKIQDKEPVISDEQVTSLSQFNTSGSRIKSEVNFDLFDEDLFALSDENNSNSSTIDEALKEAIRKKAEEAKAKPPEATFTQELTKMFETSSGGLTQFMEMYDSKVKDTDLKVERADSSSSLPRLKSSSPINSLDNELNAAKFEDDNEALSKSEEDLFADCDENIFCLADSSVSPSTKQQPSIFKNESMQTSCSSPGNNQNFTSVGVSGNEEALVKSENINEDNENGQNLNSSLSPIFKPSQNIKRPSKLRLKSKKSDTYSPAAEESINSKSAEKDPPLSKGTIRSDSYSQMDFNIVDEFNNSWLYSEAGEPHIVDVKNIDEAKNSHSHEKPRNFPGDENLEPTEGIRFTKESTPENELDPALSHVSATRKECLMSIESASSSTPKLKKQCSVLRNNESNKTSLDRPVAAGGFSFSKKSTLGNAESSLSNQGVEKEWLSAKQIRNTKDIDFLTETSAKNNRFKSGFCDNSFLNKLDTGEPENKERDVSAGAGQSSWLTSDMASNGQWNKKKLSLRSKKPKLKKEIKKIPPNPAKKISSDRKEDVVLLISSSDDESHIQHQRKRNKCKLNITSSSEEGLSTSRTYPPNAESSTFNKKRNREVFHSSSSDGRVDGIGEPHGRNAKLARTEDAPHNNSLDLSAFCDDSLLNDLMPSQNGRESPVSEDDAFAQIDKKKAKSRTKKRKKRKKSKKGNVFIMSEAEESADDQCSSSDGESTSLDELDSSFINDSQPEASQSVVDIHQKYLESVRSPAGIGRFKIPSNLREIDMDVFSQLPDASELNQTYANDSFCVDDEPTQYEPDMSLLEIAEAKLKAQRREKRKLKKALKYNDEPVKGRNALESDDSAEEVRGQRKRLKRIKVLEETICDDEEAIDASNQEKSPLLNNIGKDAPNSGTVNETNLPKEENVTDLCDDLARLLDDDLDFSNIPEIPEVMHDTGRMEPPKHSSVKFVHKKPVMSGGGSMTMNVNGSHKMASTVTFLKQTPQQSDQAASSNFSAFKPAPSATVRPSTVKTGDHLPQSQILIIASSRQIASSPDVLRVLRVSYHIIIVPHSVPDADFILSWRVGITRIFSSDLKERKKLEEVVKKLKRSFMKPHLIVENDRIKSLATVGYQKKGKKAQLNAPAPPTDQSANGQSPWSTPSCCVNAALLRQAGVTLLFSQNFDETAGFLAKLARKETVSGHGVPELAKNLSDEAETRLQFFTSLPGINLAFAIKLLLKFSTLADFLARCSSVRDISCMLGVDVNAARKIHNVLCEVHVSP